MKRVCLALALALAALNRLPAQVTVKVVMDEDQFLPGEAIEAEAQVINRSGQTLNLGSEDNWLTFSVEAHDNNYVVSKIGDVPVREPFLLETGERAKRTVDLEPYFSLNKPGRYSVTATVLIRQWGQQITSEPTSFDIIEGSKVWEQDFGVPRQGDTNGPPEVRKYVLQQANYLHTRLRLYVRVTDAAGRSFKVVPVGPYVSFSDPEPQLDRFNHLHLLYQDGPHSFSYTVFNQDGDLIKREAYDFTTRPRILPDRDGNLSVIGGTRHPKPDDLPPMHASATDAKPDVP